MAASLDFFFTVPAEPCRKRVTWPSAQMQLALITSLERFLHHRILFNRLSRRHSYPSLGLPRPDERDQTDPKELVELEDGDDFWVMDDAPVPSVVLSKPGTAVHIAPTLPARGSCTLPASAAEASDNCAADDRSKRTQPVLRRPVLQGMGGFTSGGQLNIDSGIASTNPSYSPVGVSQISMTPPATHIGLATSGGPTSSGLASCLSRENPG